VATEPVVDIGAAGLGFFAGFDGIGGSGGGSDVIDDEFDADAENMTVRSANANGHQLHNCKMHHQSFSHNYMHLKIQY
jgi:hypothetical protein